MILRSITLLFVVVFVTWSSTVNSQVLIGPTGIEYAKPGEDATLNCSIDWQSDSKTVNWIKVGESGALVEITGQGSTINVGDPTNYGVLFTAPYRYDLVIYNVDLEDDDGEYDCYFSLEGNEDGEVGTLIVLDRIDSINIVGYSGDAVVTVDENEAKQFTCESTDGNPAAELTWTIGGKDITEYSTYTTQVSDNNDKLHNSMSVLNYTFNATDNGEALKCQGFQHEDLTVRSARVYMNVKHIPIISGIGVISWSDGGVINVECVDTANPDSYQYEWEAEGGQFGTTSENTWELTDTGDDGKEEITCTATNNMGSSTSYTQIVTIPYEPTVNAITDSPLKIEAGSDAVLECGTDAVPPFPDNESWEWLQQDGSNYIQIDPSDEGYDIDPVEGDEQKTTLTVFDAQGVQTYRCQLGESYADIEVQATGSAKTGASSCDTGCIIGISVGVAVFVFVIIIIVLWFCMSRRKKKNSSEKYTSSNSNHNRQPTQPAPSDVEMTPGLTSVPPPNDDMDGPRYSNGNKYDYDDRYDNRYEDMPPHRYDDPPDNYNRYDEPPIDEGDGYPNSPTEPTYAGPYSRSPGRQAEPQLQYADLDLRGPTSQSTPNYPQPPRTEYATITPTIV